MKSLLTLRRLVMVSMLAPHLAYGDLSENGDDLIWSQPLPLQLQLPRGIQTVPLNMAIIQDHLANFQANHPILGKVPITFVDLPTHFPVGITAFVVTAQDQTNWQSQVVGNIVVWPAPANHPPKARDDYFIANAGEITVLLPLNNDHDQDGDRLQIQRHSSSRHGSVRLGEDLQSLSYQANRSFSGFDSFYYELSDNYGGSALGRVVVTVQQAGNPATQTPEYWTAIPSPTSPTTPSP